MADSSATGKPVSGRENTAGEHAETFCSQCGRKFGPGNEGYSHCSDHIYDAGIEAAAKFIDAKVADYVHDHGVYDPETGFTEFRRGGEEYVSTLEELTEEIRALKTRSTAATPTKPAPSAEVKE